MLNPLAFGMAKPHMVLCRRVPTLCTFLIPLYRLLGELREAKRCLHSRVRCRCMQWNHRLA